MVTSVITQQQTIGDRPIVAPNGMIDIGGLPSNFVSYDWDNLYIRPFRVGDLQKLAYAREQGLKVIIDVIGGCINRNVRELTIGDFIFILYWERIHSYVKSPLKFSYVSKYGNTNDVVVNESNLKIVETKLTKEQYEEWSSKGYAIPRVADMEYIESLKGTKEQKGVKADILDDQNVQWYGHWNTPVEQKLKELADKELLWYEDLKEWKDLVHHGVDEIVKVVDAKFDPNKYIERLEQTIFDLSDDADMFARNGRQADAIMVNREVQLLKEELDKIRTSIDEGKEVVAEPEELKTSISADTFLSII